MSQWKSHLSPRKPKADILIRDLPPQIYSDSVTLIKVLTEFLIKCCRSGCWGVALFGWVVPIKYDFSRFTFTDLPDFCKPLHLLLELCCDSHFVEISHFHGRCNNPQWEWQWSWHIYFYVSKESAQQQVFFLSKCSYTRFHRKHHVPL